MQRKEEEERPEFECATNGLVEPPCPLIPPVSPVSGSASMILEKKSICIEIDGQTAENSYPLIRWRAAEWNRVVCRPTSQEDLLLGLRRSGRLDSFSFPSGWLGRILHLWLTCFDGLFFFGMTSSALMARQRRRRAKFVVNDNRCTNPIKRMSDPGTQAEPFNRVGAGERERERETNELLKRWQEGQ